MVVNAGGEHLDLFPEVFDTVVMVNVLEHTNNAVSLLRGLYNAIKPGGLLIFNERWWDSMVRPTTSFDLNTLYHPIRVKKAVIEKFLSGFVAIRDCRADDCSNPDMKRYGLEGTYFIFI